MQKSNKVLRAQAIPFILIQDKKENDKVNYEFVLQREAIDIFNAIKHKKIAVATVAGPQRSGKSFLSNRLLKRMTGFAIGPSTMPCTKGLWIWGQPIEINQDTVLIIMDTEGLNSVQRDINVDLKIFALSILLSSVFIYNSLGAIDQRAIENISYVLRISENIRIKDQKAEDADLAQIFPFFYWVLRDFSLDLKGMSENEYLEKALMPVSNDEKQQKNQIRSKIRKLFTQRKCQCFPRPINDQDKLAHIEDLHFDDLRQKFRDKMKQFQRVFYQTLPPKLINGRPLTGDIYINLVREYLDAFNHGKVPEVMASVDRILEAQFRQISEQMMAGYREAMNKVASDKPTDQIIIERNHRACIAKIQSKIQQKLKSWIKSQKMQDKKAKFLEALEKDYKERLKKNSTLCTEQCNLEFSKFAKVFYQLPQMESVDKLLDKFFTEKINDYNKSIKTYFEACKAPRKYLYFMEKFPKATLDYFELYVAKAVGLFNDQISALKSEGRVYQAKIDSLNRLVQQMEKSLDQKQKQVDAINNEKDTVRRQLQLRIHEINSSQMNKSDLKKNYDALQRNYSQLQLDYQKLEEQIRKMKTEMNEKSHKYTEMARQISSQPSQSTQAHTNLPNDLIGVLSTLKDKMSSVKEYFESTVPDDSLQGKLLRDIENLRSEKYKELEKLKDKHNIKLAEQKEKFNREVNDYENKFRMLNRYVDELKIKNMQLQEQLNHTLDKKGGSSWNAEKRHLEEALRLKQNIINGQKTLISEKDRRIGDLQLHLANSSSKLADFQSYRETFPYILNELLNFVQGKNNKLKHSIKTLTNDDEYRVRQVFKKHSQLGIQV